jgi:hypothetical protein
VDVTLIRLAAPLAGAATYVAVPTSQALYVLAHAPAVFTEQVAVPMGLDPTDVDVNTMPWETLPGIEPLATAAIAAAGHITRPVMFIGTAVRGQWTSWYPHVPPCPPPPTD